MCIAQIILLLIYLLIETSITLLTFILTLGQYYYHSRWHWYGRLQLLDSSNPLLLDTESRTVSTSPKSPALALIEMAKQKGNGTPKQRYTLSPQHDDDESRSDHYPHHSELAANLSNHDGLHPVELVHSEHPKIVNDPSLNDVDIRYKEVDPQNGHQNGSQNASTNSMNPCSQSPGSLSPRTKTINILTQNLWIHYLAPAPSKRKRLRAFIDFLRDHHREYDVLIIQEIFGLRLGCFVRCNELEFLVKSLYKMGYVHCTKPSGVLPVFGQNGGIMLFSKFPLQFDDVWTFRRSDELMLRKGFAIAIANVPLHGDRVYPLCIGTGHCDPYRPKVILSQIQQFSESVRTQCEHYRSQHGQRLPVIVGGDFNTRNSALVKGLQDHFEDAMAMYNGWTLKGLDRSVWDREFVTYRSAYLPKWRTWGSMLTCDWIKLPTLHAVTGKYKKGYCLDHLLTNVDRSMVEDINTVDTRHGDVFVSDHLGVELVLKIPCEELEESVVYQV